MGLLGADVPRQCEAMCASHQVICLQAAGNSCCLSQRALAGLADLLEQGSEACWNHVAQRRCCRSLLQGGAPTWTACWGAPSAHRTSQVMQAQALHLHQAGCIPSCPSSSMAPPTTGSRAAVGQATVGQTASHAGPHCGRRHVSQRSVA